MLLAGPELSQPPSQQQSSRKRSYSDVSTTSIGDELIKGKKKVSKKGDDDKTTTQPLSRKPPSSPITTVKREVKERSTPPRKGNKVDLPPESSKVSNSTKKNDLKSSTTENKAKKKTNNVKSSVEEPKDIKKRSGSVSEEQKVASVKNEAAGENNKPSASRDKRKSSDSLLQVTGDVQRGKKKGKQTDNASKNTEATMEVCLSSPEKRRGVGEGDILSQPCVAVKREPTSGDGQAPSSVKKVRDEDDKATGKVNEVPSLGIIVTEKMRGVVESHVEIPAELTDAKEKLEVSSQNVSEIKVESSTSDRENDTNQSMTEESGAASKKKSSSSLESGAESVKGESVQSSYSSPRAAAQLAKSRLSMSGTNKASKSTMHTAKSESDLASTGIDATVAKPPRKSLTPRDRKNLGKKDKSKVESAPAHWVACDQCGKWRKLPGSVDASTLPDKWYCSMNQWDSLRNSCSVEEEVYLDPALESTPKSGMGKSRSAGSLSSLDSDITSVSKKGRISRGKKPIRSEEETFDDEDRKDGLRGSRGNKRRSKSAGRSELDPVAEDMVSWVQCNKCSKWRKVPADIGDALPDVWHCTMNTWAPAYAKCSVKEEGDEKVDEGKAVKDKKTTSTGPGRGRYVRVNRKSEMEASNIAQATATALAAGKTVVKKIQWVQCERKNCKKWRKIPIEVNLESLPELWYCEMNRWDPERASCEIAEDSDDEGDQPANQAARTQLILGNSKGPGTLSYRRLIFGADGRLRPFYSEKNKNGYGLFSFTEVFRPADTDEYILPIRRIAYWSSSAFDSSSQVTVQPKKKRKNEEEEPPEAPKIDFQSSCSKFRPDQSTDLLDCIHRLSGSCNDPVLDDPAPLPKLSKAFPPKKRYGLFRRMQLACCVVQNYLLMFSGEPQPQTFDDIFHGISSLIFFQNPEFEYCRATMGKCELRDTLHCLDQKGTVEATFDNDGDLSFRLLLQRSVEQGVPITPNTCPALLASSEPTPLGGKALPLKMRKRKIGIQSLPSEPVTSAVISSSSSSSLSDDTSNKEAIEKVNDPISNTISEEPKGSNPSENSNADNVENVLEEGCIATE